MPTSPMTADAAIQPPTPEAQRPTELVDWLDRHLFHPPARWLALALKPTGISPDLVSIAGALVMCAAAAAYVGLDWPQSATIGFLVQFLAGVIDGADGDLARLTGKSSAYGEVVDAACDYAGQIVLYIALTIFLSHWIGGWAWIAASLAGLSHIIQMNHAESQRRHYLWWAYRVPWFAAQADATQGETRAGWLSRSFAWLASQYIRLANAMTPYAARVDAAVEDPQQGALISRLAQDTFGRAIFFQQALSANPRWIALGVSMLLGSPLWYFLFEITAMNLLLVVSLREHNRRTRDLADAAARGSAHGV